VAATTIADRRYSWSNFGPWVRVAAPGCNVAPILAGGYGNFCGTSSATPLVTGLIALELSANPTATAAQVELALAQAAVPLPDVVQHGRIDAGRTLSLLRPTSVTRATAVFRGTIARRARERGYRVEVAAGKLTASLRFTGTGSLALLLTRARDNKPIARVAGRSPLRLQASVAAGTFRLRVVASARARATFVLTVSYLKRA
jgi:subtilisin family serine protease